MADHIDIGIAGLHLEVLWREMHHPAPPSRAVFRGAVALLVVAACAGDDGKNAPTRSPGDDDDGPTEDTTPIGDTATTPSTGGSGHTGRPNGWRVEAELLLVPSEQLQAAEIGIDAPADAQLMVSWTDGAGHTLSHAPPAGTDVLPILGLRPDRTYTVTVTAALGDATDDTSVTFDSAPLSPDFPQTDLVVAGTEEHFTLMSTRGYGPIPSPSELVVVLDQDAEVVYWRAFQSRMRDVRPIEGGFELMYGNDFPIVARFPWIGDHYAGFQSVETTAALDPLLTTIDAPGRLHHDYIEAPDGTFFALSKEVVPNVNYPDDYDLQSASLTDIVGDVVHHFAADGTSLGTLRLADVIQTERIGSTG